MKSDEELDAIATEWVNSMLPSVFKSFEDLGMQCNDEATALIMTDSFIAGFRVSEEMK